MSGASSAKGATSDESRAKRHETAKDEEIMHCEATRA